MALLREKYIGFIGLMIALFSFFTDRFLLPGFSLGFNICILVSLFLKIYFYDIRKKIPRRSKVKWDLVWNGIRISAVIGDDDFSEKIRRQKIHVKQGDSIIADIRIHQELDPFSQIYFNRDYNITNINFKPGNCSENPNS